jgi:pilus assembly protein CpaC
LGPDRAPTASFIDSLRSNDAAFEVVVGQGRLLTTKVDIVGKQKSAVIAVGDPTVVEFEILPNPRMLRITGKRAGVTDLSITAADGQTYSFEIYVVYDLDFLRAQLRQTFPDADLRIAQLREHLVVEGQARSPEQVTQIVRTIEAYLESVQVPSSTGGQQAPAAAQPQSREPTQRQPRSKPSQGAKNLEPDETPPDTSPSEQPSGQAPEEPSGEAVPEARGTSTTATFAKPRIINLIRVPGVHQVSLQVRIAELNRTALREIGNDFLWLDSDTGNSIGTAIAGTAASALTALGVGVAGPSATAFGVFPTGDFELLIKALRKNSLLSILAEPNLMAMSGQRASFLAGGEFPVPVPQTGGAQTGAITIEWKKFGVQLDFVPYVLDDEMIRLQVQPEVSTIDQAIGVTVLGTSVPGINSRKAQTTVELRQGQTLAIAGLLSVAIDGQTSRVPGLGDLPYIGPLFSNTSHRKVEKELLVLVTPYLVAPQNADQVHPLPGAEIEDPNDLEFFFLNRIEGRTGKNFQSTKSSDDPLGLVRLMKLERRCMSGPVGFSE